MAIIKIETNIPIIGTPKYADMAESQYGPQLKLKGTWNGQADSLVYLNETCKGQMQTLGILAEAEGKLRIVGTPRIKILRTESEGRKRTNVSIDGAAPTNGHTNGHAAPSHTNGHANGNGNGAAVAGESPRVGFLRLKLTLAACIKASREAWAGALPPGEIAPFETVAASAHSLFIAAERRGCLSPAPKEPDKPISDAQKADIDAVSQRLAANHMWTVDRIKTEILAVTQAADFARLTEPQAKAAIAHLEEKCRQADEAAAIAAQAQAERQTAMALPTAGYGDEVPF